MNSVLSRFTARQRSRESEQKRLLLDKTAITSLLDRFFQCVSFESGQKPAYEELQTLFVPGAQLIKTSGERPRISTVEQFIHDRSSQATSGRLSRFREHEMTQQTQIFGRVGQRFSTYRKTGEQVGTTFDTQGKISTQVIQTPDGWKISAMAWDDERPGLHLTHPSVVDRHDHRPCRIPGADHYIGSHPLPVIRWI